MGGTLRDRIREFRRVPAGEQLDHDGNPRRHPQDQGDALRGVLEQVGVAAGLISYLSESGSGRLRSNHTKVRWRYSGASRKHRGTPGARAYSGRW